jgi:hypothetical protein
MRTRFLGRASLARDDDERFPRGAIERRTLFLILQRTVTIRGVLGEWVVSISDGHELR